MPCCGVRSTYGISPEKCYARWEEMAAEHGCDVLIVGVRDQKVGKVCIAGAAHLALVDAIERLLKADSPDAVVLADETDMMWQYTIRNTRMTTGRCLVSWQKPFFPRGRLLVQLLDLISSFGWGLAAAPNFRGSDVTSKDICYDWPVFVFYREEEASRFTSEHLFLSVKDTCSKLCAAGPMGDELQLALTEVLQQHKHGVTCQKDHYDDDYDAVWRDISLTTGSSKITPDKANFPKGRLTTAVLECLYSFGWRAVAAPNFGAMKQTWPCLIFRRLHEPDEAPELLFASIKDSSIPGKLCLSGPSAERVADSICTALSLLPGNRSAISAKDNADDDHDAVCRYVSVTTGLQKFSLALRYFPRGDSMRVLLDTLAHEGFRVVACPNFGGNRDSWPSFIFERCEATPRQMFMAVKDSNVPGKLDFVGGGVSSDVKLTHRLTQALVSLCGPSVTKTMDDYDETYELAYRNTVITTGHATFCSSAPYWPHGFVVATLLQILLRSGWRATGGPNFGDSGNHWPGIIFASDEA